MTFVIKTRGSPSQPIAAEYLCPEHGRFELDVDRNEVGEAPDNIRCLFASADDADAQCLHIAEWVISSPMCRVRKLEAVKGKWQKPERPTWTDTRNLGEGQPLYEWRERRAEIWEQRRKEDVMKFAKEH